MEGGKEGRSRRPARPSAPRPARGRLRGAAALPELREAKCWLRKVERVSAVFSLAPQLSTTHGSAEMNDIDFLSTRKICRREDGSIKDGEGHEQTFPSLLFLLAPSHAPKGLVFNVVFKRLLIA